MNRSLLAVLAICFTLSNCMNTNHTKTTKETTTSDNNTLIVSDEVNAFWEIFNTKEKRNELLASYVLDSVNHEAVHTMYKMTLNDTTLFTSRITQFENYYKSIQKQSLAMANKDYPKLGEYYVKFKKMYPKAHKPKIIFSVGALTVGGTITDNGLVIGTEFYGKKSGDTIGMGRMANYLLIPDDFVPLTFHEHMHYEQLKIAGSRENLFRQERTLLSACLNEGAADFVSNLVTGWNDQKPNYIYGKKNEKELWAKFKEDIQTDTDELITNWMYDYNIEKDTPPDLGYFMGAAICKSYYDNATDKAQAIEDILSIKDPKEFLAESKYGEKFID